MENTNNYVSALWAKVKNMDTRNKISIFAVFISVFTLLFNMYITFHPFDKAEIKVKSNEKLYLALSSESTIYIQQYFSLKNYGKASGVVSSIEALIVSKSADAEGNPNYRRHFSDVFSYEAFENIHYPFMDCFLYPNGSWTYNFVIHQRKSSLTNPITAGTFAPGKYEYLIIFGNDKGEQICVMCYEFSIDEGQFNRMCNENEEGKACVDLTPLHEQQRIDKLLKDLKSFKRTGGYIN